MANYYEEDEWSASAVSLLILTILYFIIEIIINISVYQQLAISGTAIGVDVLEYWGRFITGFGMALLITRWRARRIGIETRVFKTFFLVSLLTVPLSFKLQDSLIEYVVAQSTKHDQNQAVLVMAAHTTIVPFYETSHSARKLELSKIDKLKYPFYIKTRLLPYYYVYEERDLLMYAASCVESSEQRLGVSEPLDKAFFSYTAYKKGIDAKLYKSVIKDYHLCLYENDRHFFTRTKDRFNDKIIDEVYQSDYLPGSNEYDKYAGRARSQANKKWRERMDGYLGFKSSIGPGLSRAAFRKHPDVQRYYEEKTGVKGLSPKDKNFKEKVMKQLEKDLPGVLIPTYYNADYSYYKEDMKYETSLIAETGERAYKALIMPLVAMGLSAFFLVLNIIMAIYFIIAKRASKQVAVTFLVIAIAWFLFYPLIQSDDPTDKLDDSGYDSANIVEAPVEYDYAADNGTFIVHGHSFSPAAKWLWFHERNLSKVYNVYHAIPKPGIIDAIMEEEYEKYVRTQDSLSKR